MDWIMISLLGLLVINITLIIIVLTTLPHHGDERKKLIKMKSQSFTFTVVIGLFIYEMGKSMYIQLWGDGTYGGMSPHSYLTSISLIYLITLLYWRRKYA
ncbi:hypothetical protein B0H94_11270 [Salsuginibacillus halophilus]|uniref:Uncharacterized protein n=1 Tax=Salsuginibacillus halophilus TaxID=517424 RepID=A0A2P8H9T1_9BACI|nr:hypothetical protein [Salsuginibacillus halophilus]PSL42987.1 hypothetical protein B0H94_11270 [Salsuginibacillus halophilus]